MENQDLQKHLVSVIDEAISEIEELKKSKFAAQEIKMEAGDDGIAGMKANGSMDKMEDCDKKEDDDMDKADGVNNEADPSKGDFKQADTVGKGEDCDDMDKAEDEDEDEDEKKKKEMEKHDGKNNEADPSKGDFKQADTVGKAEDDMDKKEDDDKDMEKSKKEEDDLAKSVKASEELMKSYVDEKFTALEKSIAGILESVKALADSPAPSKGVQADQFAALQKSNDDTFEPLNKSYVADKLIDLKKSGENVDSADIIKVETGGQNDIVAVANKYGLVKR